MPKYKIYKIHERYYTYIYVDISGVESPEEITNKLREFFNNRYLSIYEIDNYDIPNLYEICENE